MVSAKSLVALVFSASLATATLSPASSNTKGKCPGTLNCDQTQTFAVFVTDHQYDSSHGAPYGTCKAYTCTAPTDAEMTDSNVDCWTFFWK
ncbi:hypothetical protein APSETT444_005172 [Aspergillus pseudonomiae]